MKTTGEIKTTGKGTLTSAEKSHMKLVQEAIDENNYNPPNSKEKRIRNALNKALSEK